MVVGWAFSYNLLCFKSRKQIVTTRTTLRERLFMVGPSSQEKLKERESELRLFEHND